MIRKNKDTNLYEIEVPSFVLELDQEEIDLLNQYWDKRNGSSLEKILEIAEGGIPTVIEVILSEGIKRIGEI